MGDSNMNNDDELVDLNEIDLDAYIAGKSQNALKEDDGNLNGQDWTFDNEQKAPSVNGDPRFYDPYLPAPFRGSVEDIQHKLKITGTRLRRDLNRSLHTDPQAWEALRRPASIHSAQRTLAEMLVSLPSADQEHFHELGGGYVYMPLSAMENFLYPTLRVMQHLHGKRCQYEYTPGGVESMIVYSFFHQGGGAPKNRTEHDLRILRNTVFPAGSDLPDQLRTNVEVKEGLSTHLRSTLRRLRELTALPSIDKLGDMTAESLDERQAEIDALLGIYSEHITKDYQT
jgi:hypothetical protein